MLALNISKWSNKDGTEHLFKNIPKYNAKKKNHKNTECYQKLTSHIYILHKKEMEHMDIKADMYSVYTCM